jgi:release factor glutamine methyltransferase
VAARLRAAGCVFAEDEARLLIQHARSVKALEGLHALESLVADRERGVPLEHLLGWVDFAGVRVLLDPGVFVPRRRTQLLAAEARRLTLEAPYRPTLVELCCGSGAVSAAVLAAAPRARLVAADLDAREVACARRNLGDLVLLGDLYDPLPGDLAGQVDVLVANAPYVPSGAVGLMPLEAREHEPLLALDGGGDGLDVLRRVITGAPPWLRPGASLLVECGESQTREVRALMLDCGLAPRVERDEELGATIVAGRAG